MDALCPESLVTSANFQAPNPKQTPINKIQNSKPPHPSPLPTGEGRGEGSYLVIRYENLKFVWPACAKPLRRRQGFDPWGLGSILRSLFSEPAESP